MADSREFTLIGSFQDDITPKLNKLNTQLNSLKTSFGNLGGKGARNTSRDLGRLSVSITSLTDNLKQQNIAFRASVAPLREFRLEIGKTIAAYKQLNLAGGNTRGLEATNRALREQMRLMEMVQRRESQLGRTRRTFYGGTSRPSVGAGAGSYVPPPRSRGGYSSRGGRVDAGAGGMSAHMAEFGFAYTLGNIISGGITSAITTGFNIGVGLMKKPFEYFADSLKERMDDELSDLKAAGGIYSISQRQEEGKKLFKNFDQAIQFTQESNKIMAKLGATLPMDTQDYVEVGKRISDSITRTVLKDTTGSVKLAERLRAADTKIYGAQAIQGSDLNAQKKSIQVLMGELSKQTVLAGIGGGGRGARGAYGLPQLSERMLSQDEVSMAQMQRYAAIFADPAIKDALERHIPKINAASKETGARLEAIIEMYKEVVTPELIERYRRSLAGVMEGFNSAIFGKEYGLFGIGRKMKGMGKKFNEFGQMIDWYGKVTEDVTKQANEDLAIYDLFRDIIGNLGQIILPIVENLSLIWDPLRKLGLDLGKIREVTFRLVESFNSYKNAFLEYGEDLKGDAKKMFQGTEEFRATLLTIGNLFADFGVYTQKQYDELVTALKDPKIDLGKILTGMIDTFFQSEVGVSLGETIGRIVSTVIQEVAKMTGFISGRIGGTEGLAKGFTKGFGDKGREAVQQIIKDVFSTIGKVILEIWDMLSFGEKMGAIMLVLLPPVAQFIGMKIGESIIAGMTRIGASMSGSIPGQMQRGANRNRGAVSSFFSSRRNEQTRRNFTSNVRRTMTGPGYTSPIGPTPDVYTDYLGRKTTRRKGPGYMPSGVKKGFISTITEGFKRLVKEDILDVDPDRRLIRQKGRAGNIARGAARFGKTMGGITSRIPGGAIAGGALTGIASLASGESAGDAFGQAAASTIGGVIGSFAGPWGTVIGTSAGPLIYNWVKDSFQPSANSLESASKALETVSKGAEKGPGGSAALGTLGQVFKGGGAELSLWAQRQKELNLITSEQYEKYSILATQLSAANAATEAAKIAQTDYASVSRISVKGSQEETAAAKRLEKAKEKETLAVQAAEKTWSEMPTQLKGSLLAVDTALRDFATRVYKYTPPTPTATQSLNSLPLWQQLLVQGNTKGQPGGAFWRGGLGDAISSELKHKPSNSHLVIANSSETIIPAAGGHGMLDFVRTLRAGFSTMVAAYREEPKLGNASIRAYTSGRGESGGGNFGDINVTVNTNGVNNDEELAYRIADVISKEVDRARASSIFV